MIFSRRRGGGGRHHQVDDARRTRRPGTERAYDGSGPVDEAPPTSGPYDVTEAPAGVERLDLGSMWIPAVPGVEMRVQADPEGQIQQVVLVAGESALQLGVFAAPRSEGVWDEVREEIRKQLFNDGVAAEEIDGRYGVELRSRVRTPEGFTDIRFVGVDGPRWMVRGVYQGAAAVDPAEAGPLAECLDGLVVDRGTEAMPVREPLPLRLPREMAEQSRHADDTGDASLETEAPVGVESAGPRPGAGAAPAGARPVTPSPRRSKPSPRPRGRA